MRTTFRRTGSWLTIAATFTLLAGTRASERRPPSRFPTLARGRAEKVATGFGFTEGPAWDGKSLLYFTDIPNARIHTVNADGETAVFVDETGPCNGLMFNREGELVACNMGGQLVAWNVETKEKRVLAGEFEGKRFNAPNDLVIDAAGGVYFTDPMFRAPQPLPQGVQGVYYRERRRQGVASGRTTCRRPTASCCRATRRRCTCCPSMLGRDAGVPGRVAGQARRREVFCKVKNPPDAATGGCDGATIDEHGNLYLTTGAGLQVFSERAKRSA